MRSTLMLFNEKKNKNKKYKKWKKKKIFVEWNYLNRHWSIDVQAF